MWSARTGLLSLAALIVSLYPVVVAVLAHQFVGERLHPRLRLGSVACVIALGLIAVG